MTQFALFPTKTAADEDDPQIAHVLIAGIHDTLIEQHPLPSRVVRMTHNLGIRYIGEAELAAAELEPAFWICPIAPSALDRRVLFETLANEVVEQDERGQIWIDDQLLIPRGLVSFGSADREREGEIRLGESAALLLAEHQEGGWAVRVRITAPVVWLFEGPRPISGVPILDGWMQMAARAQRASQTA
jgi:hypothetical protein